MSDGNEIGKLSKIFKGVAIGIGTAVIAAVALPVITVSAPVIIIGGVVGGIIAAKKDDNGPKNG